MSEKRLATLDPKELQEQILVLKHELEVIQKEIHAFEALLSSRLSDLIVEAQELFNLYKQIKKAKKAKRLEQKKRGKNYTEPIGLKLTSKKRKEAILPEYQKEKKRLYREAMLYVHPDKFHLNENESDIASKLTTKLIEIYKNESLEKLQAFHAHIFNGNPEITLDNTAAKVKVFSKDNYLQKEKEALEKAITLARDGHLYKVLKEYKNPLTFAGELKQYYEERISQLKRRTRKGL